MPTGSVAPRGVLTALSLLPWWPGAAVRSHSSPWEVSRHACGGFWEISPAGRMGTPLPLLQAASWIEDVTVGMAATTLSPEDVGHSQGARGVHGDAVPTPPPDCLSVTPAYRYCRQTVVVLGFSLRADKVSRKAQGLFTGKELRQPRCVNTPIPHTARGQYRTGHLETRVRPAAERGKRA